MFQGETESGRGGGIAVNDALIGVNGGETDIRLAVVFVVIVVIIIGTATGPGVIVVGATTAAIVPGAARGRFQTVSVGISFCTTSGRFSVDINVRKVEWCRLAVIDSTATSIVTAAAVAAAATAVAAVAAVATVATVATVVAVTAVVAVAGAVALTRA